MYAYDNLKLTWGGNIYGDKDIWSNGLHIGYEDISVPLLNTADLNTLLAGIPAILSDYFADADLGISQYATLNWVKLAQIGTDGLYRSDAAIYDFPGGIPGGNPDPIVPQNSVVVSLLTGATRGLAKNGRYYLPVSGEVGVTGVMSDTQINAIASESQIFLNALNSYLDATDSVGSLIVASNQRTGMNRFINEVRVGNVVDTQRSRRNNFVEKYLGYPVA